MKIVEPNTPYVYYDEDSDKAKSATGEYAGAPAHTSTGELDFTELSSIANRWAVFQQNKVILTAKHQTISLVISISLQSGGEVTL